MAKKEPKLKCPNELETVWSPEIEKAFKALNTKQQIFVLEFVKCGFVGAEAYRRAYNTMANDNTACVCASNLLRTPNIQTILEGFTDSRLEDLFLTINAFKGAAQAQVFQREEIEEDGVKKSVYVPAFGLDQDGRKIPIPDHDMRIKGGQALAKLRGFNKPEKIEDDRIGALAELLAKVK